MRDAVLTRRMFAGPQSQQMGNAPQTPAALAEAMGQDFEAQAQEAGAKYADDMMSALDGAQTPADAINALRGKDLPIEAYYEELSQIVGEDDAVQTPESVLALIQPTVMMMGTDEEGGLESMFSAFLEDAEMVGDMAGGIAGQLDAQQQGAGQAPIQRFRDGGEVIKGGTTGIESLYGRSKIDINKEAPVNDLRSYYEQALPMMSEIIGTSDEDRKRSKANLWFALAQSGLQLAAGRRADGSNMADQSFASQLAEAAMPLGPAFSAEAEKLAAKDRDARTAALNMATQDRASAIDARTSAEQFNREVDFAGVQQEARQAHDELMADKNFQQRRELEILKHGLDKELAAYELSIESTAGAGGLDFGKSMDGRIATMLNNSNNLALVMEGKAPPGLITAYRMANSERTVWDEVSGRMVLRPAMSLAPVIHQAFQIGGYVDEAGNPLADGEVETLSTDTRPGGRGPNLGAAGEVSRSSPPPIISENYNPDELDVNAMFGPETQLDRTGNALIPIITGLGGGKESEGLNPQMRNAERLNTQLGQMAFNAIVETFPDRTTESEREIIRNELPKTGATKTATEYVARARATIARLNEAKIETQGQISSGRLSATQLTEFEGRLARIDSIIQGYRYYISEIDRGTTGDATPQRLREQEMLGNELQRIMEESGISTEEE